MGSLSPEEGPFMSELVEIAGRLATLGKGILAADESIRTAGERLASVGVENSEYSRRALRRMLFSAPLGPYISGVILFEETLFQRLDDGTPLPKLLLDQDVLVGVKVDKGVVPLPGTNNEVSTQGLDDLGKRCSEFRAAGARFCKWRAVLRIDEGCPSALAISDAARGLARFAAVAQANGLVPIVEPEILADGAHSIERCAAVTERVLAAVISACLDYRVFMEALLLKPNMVTAGSSAPPAPPADVARLTVRALQRTVPPAVAGIAFLSGGQSEEASTAHLCAINQLPAIKPWPLSFSFGRALQTSALKRWAGREANEEAAKAALLLRCRANADASLGKTF